MPRHGCESTQKVIDRILLKTNIFDIRRSKTEKATFESTGTGPRLVLIA